MIPTEIPWRAVSRCVCSTYKKNIYVPISEYIWKIQPTKAKPIRTGYRIHKIGVIICQNLNNQWLPHNENKCVKNFEFFSFCSIQIKNKLGHVITMKINTGHDNENSRMQKILNTRPVLSDTRELP